MSGTRALRLVRRISVVLPLVLGLSARSRFARARARIARDPSMLLHA